MTTAPLNRPTIDAQPDPAGILVTSSVDGFDTEYVVTEERLSAFGFIRKAKAEEHCGGNHRDPELQINRSVNEFTAVSKQVMEDWHNDHHPGVFRTCTEDPCAALVKSMGVIR
jgi:hypothetical protein